jgi:quercetin dioxygenase-like cupin family protein
MSSTTVARSEIAGAEAFSLSGLVNYQDGSVVSRVVLKREMGNVTIFAFDEGQGLSEHTSPFDALVQAVEGEAEITVAGKPIALKTGEVVLLPAEKPHAVKAEHAFQDGAHHDPVVEQRQVVCGERPHSVASVTKVLVSLLHRI